MPKRKLGKPRGKSVMLYRHLPDWAAKDTQTRGFRPNGRGQIHFTNTRHRSLAGKLVVGRVATFSAIVPHKLMRKDPMPLSSKHEKWYSADAHALKGIKVRRVT
jgi:hypothetical protein